MGPKSRKMGPKSSDNRAKSARIDQNLEEFADLGRIDEILKSDGYLKK